MGKKLNDCFEGIFSYTKCTVLILCFLFGVSSCENTDITSTKDISGSSDLKAAAPSAKKGTGMSTSTKNGIWWQNVNNLNSNWYYTWGTFIPDDQVANAPNVEFVPMLWGGSSVTATNVAKLNALYEQGKIKYVLGFNEPDLTEESNMTVAVALDKWEYLCQNLNPGIKLVSPATSYPSLKETSWMVQFMNGVQERNLRVDYIAVHIYQPNTASLFTNPVNAVYERWGKKVWITEFGVRDESTGGDPTKNRYTREQMVSFMETLLPQLEDMEAVDRYAWFNSSPTIAGLWPCGLVDTDGSLTILGNYYRDFQFSNSDGFDAGDGSVGNPYKISRASQFNKIRNYPDKNFLLTANIDLSTLSPAWTPITSFSGTIDGGNRQVQNLKFSSIGTKGGLITTNTGNIKNIAFTGVNITATSAFGVIVGDHSTGTINNVVVKGTVVSTNTTDLLGGVVAEISGGQISDVYVNLSMEGTCGMIGGIVGRAKTAASTIANCTSEGSINIKAAKSRIGGIVGRGETAVTIKNCLSTMNIKGSINGANGVGGIFGANSDDGMRIDECMFTGQINNVFMCGGIGGVAANIRNCAVEGTGASLSSPIVNVGGTINTSSGGGIAGVGKGALENCIVYNAALTGVTSTTLSLAGIVSTFQNNGYAAKCVASNVLVNGVTIHGIAGTAGNGKGVNTNNYSADGLYYEAGAVSKYIATSNKDGLDGESKKASDLTQAFYQGLGYDFTNIWSWNGSKPVLRNVGYKGSLSI